MFSSSFCCLFILVCICVYGCMYPLTYNSTFMFIESWFHFFWIMIASFTSKENWRLEFIFRKIYSMQHIPLMWKLFSFLGKLIVSNVISYKHLKKMLNHICLDNEYWSFNGFQMIKISTFEYIFSIGPKKLPYHKV